jgi:hypothetical protein
MAPFATTEIAVSGEAAATSDSITGLRAGQIIRDARLELAQLRRQLAQLTGQLPEAEHRVTFRHCFQQQAFDEIAVAWGSLKGASRRSTMPR